MDMSQGMDMMKNMDPNMMKAGMDMMKNMDPAMMKNMSKMMGREIDEKQMEQVQKMMKDMSQRWQGEHEAMPPSAVLECKHMPFEPTSMTRSPVLIFVPSST